MEGIKIVLSCIVGVFSYALLLKIGSTIIFKSLYEEKTKYKENKYGKSDG